MNWTTPKRAKLIDDAAAAGHEICREGNRINIMPLRRGRPGLTLWADGTATRNDVSLDMCLTIRTIKDMRKVLDL